MASRQQAEEMLIRKAQQDAAFRAELLANPRAAIKKQLGIDLPADLTITVVQEDARSLFLVLPPESGSGELSDQELASVAGGRKENDDAGKFSKPGAVDDAADARLERT